MTSESGDSLLRDFAACRRRLIRCSSLYFALFAPWRMWIHQNTSVISVFGVSSTAHKSGDWTTQSRQLQKEEYLLLTRTKTFQTNMVWDSFWCSLLWTVVSHDCFHAVFFSHYQWPKDSPTLYVFYYDWLQRSVSMHGPIVRPWPSTWLYVAFSECSLLSCQASHTWFLFFRNIYFSFLCKQVFVLLPGRLIVSRIGQGSFETQSISSIIHGFVCEDWCHIPELVLFVLLSLMQSYLEDKQDTSTGQLNNVFSTSKAAMKHWWIILNL